MKKKHKRLLTALSILALAQPPAYAAEYLYDPLNRLTRVIYQSGITINYHYDAGGNLVSITTTGISTYILSGIVTDSEGQPLPDVLISLGEYSVITNQEGYYNLIEIPAGDYTLTATKTGYDFSPQPITIGSDQSPLLNLTANGPIETQCLLYAVHDKGRKNSQFFTVDPAQEFSVKLLGDLHLAKDLEAMDISPDNQIFVASGDDGLPPGMLYTLNARTGELYPVNSTGTGFNEINGLSFNIDGSLWAWAEGDGLILIDPATGIGDLIYASKRKVEDLTWNLDGTTLYIIEKNQLLAYSTETGYLTGLNCQLPGGEIEALEMLPDGEMLFATHQNKLLNLHALNPDTCQLLGVKISTQIDDDSQIKLDDVEGIAWPINACTSN
jgi:YD repeat-containing protein